MIGVIPKRNEFATIEEFFQLFKTPWEIYRPGASYEVVLTAGEVPRDVAAPLVLIYGSEADASDEAIGAVAQAQRQGARLEWRGSVIPLYGQLLTFKPVGEPVVATTVKEAAGVQIESADTKKIRVGYDLFEEVAFLLRSGQPLENAAIPTLDLHIALLRELILANGGELVEIAPSPAGYDFAVCLTHDIDFVGIRRHRFDHTMCGFLFRATVGASLNFLRGKSSFGRLLRCWKAVLSLPFVQLGWAKDFWMPFDWYLEVEKGLSPTYYFIPVKHRAGDRVNVPHAKRRASDYDITDIPEWIARLKAEGCEIGVHGIDAWNSVEKAREEFVRVARVAGVQELGIRTHWLMRDEESYAILERAGYSYDSTNGYNETPGYLNGTAQVFLPPGAKTLLELPMHIQDGALFFPGRLNLSDAEAAARCDAFIENARKHGGVLTFIWHDRSHAAERFWGDFYAGLVRKLKAGKIWFAQAGQAVGWFRERREVRFARTANGTTVCGGGRNVSPPMNIRVQRAGEVVEIPWDGERDIQPLAGAKSRPAAPVAAVAHAI